MTEQTSPDLTPAPSDPAAEATAPAAAPLEMEQRMRALGDVATWEDVDPEAHRAWDAPYGPPEEWGLL
ncbi:MAG: hypothetical protein ACTH9F_10115, partial [Brachybacterium tyrofermentans]